MSKLIYLDPGHGGKDSGAVNGKRHEADDVLQLAKKIKTLLSDYDCKVGLTRTGDTYTSPSGKARMANDAGADFLVSLHRNSAGPSAKGYETLVYGNSGTKKEFANKINQKMKEIGFVNRGTKIRIDLSVLKVSSMPAVLLEIGFISNSSDNKLFDNEFDSIAKAITETIADVNGLKRISKAGKKKETVTAKKSTEKKASSSKPSKKEIVKDLQAACNKQGYSDQEVDGIAGKNTLAGCPTLRSGASGEITKCMQRLLKYVHGYDLGKYGCDGDFGNVTKAAVKKFQKTNNLTTDGIVGRKTWKKLLGI